MRISNYEKPKGVHFELLECFMKYESTMDCAGFHSSTARCRQGAKVKQCLLNWNQVGNPTSQYHSRPSSSEGVTDE